MSSAADNIRKAEYNLNYVEEYLHSFVDQVKGTGMNLTVENILRLAEVVTRLGEAQVRLAEYRARVSLDG